MEVRVITEPTTEPLTLAMVKDFCHIDADYTGDDAVLSILLSSSRELLERFLNLSLAPKQIEIQVDGGYTELPYGPHTQIVSVKDFDGNTIDPDNYVIGGLDFKYIDTCSVSYSYFYPLGGGDPTVYILGTNRASGINIIADVGYTSQNLKSALKGLILRLVDYMYQNRGSVVSELPDDIRTDAAVYSRNLVL